jgi:2-methylcitrate dehydratase PrpD
VGRLALGGDPGGRGGVQGADARRQEAAVSASLAHRLADDVAAIAREPLSTPVLRRAQDLLLDYLGVALGGAPEESSRVLRRGLAALGTLGTATVLGTRERMAPPHAALANGAAAHALEMDDTHQGGSIHLGVTVFSAALAAAELAGASGERVLHAAVAGYEVAARLAMALDPAAHYARGFHPTGTCGAFGAAATAAVVLGLDAGAVAAALGIAGSQAAGSMEFLADGAWTKRFHPGWAACAGLHAAALARAGFRAPATVLEGRFGFLHAYSDAAAPAPILAHDGFELMRTSIKPHACCRYMQGPIDAALALRAAHAIDAATIDRIEVGMLAAGFAIVCEPIAAKRRPASTVDAQFSLPFGIAVALVRGRAAPDDFAAPTWDDRTIRLIMEHVDPVRDARLDAAFPRAWPCWLRIARREGATLEARVDHPRGDPENFPGDDELAAKFRILAGRSLSAPAVARLEEAVAAFPRATSAAPLLAATVS